MDWIERARQEIIVDIGQIPADQLQQINKAVRRGEIEILKKQRRPLTYWCTALRLRPLMAKGILIRHHFEFISTVDSYKLPSTKEQIAASLAIAEKNIPKSRKKFWNIIEQLKWK